MILFGRELSLEQMIGLVECQATPDEDLVHRAALEIIAALRESQRMEQAAVEDMKLIVDAVREKHCDETCCFACKFDCDTSITDSGDHACECPGFERDDCFEWRGFSEREGWVEWIN